VADVSVTLTEQERDHLVVILEMVEKRRSPRAVLRTAQRMNFQGINDKLRKATAEAAPPTRKKATRKSGGGDDDG